MVETLEAAASKRARKGKVEEMILSALALAGILTLAAAAPNTLQLLKYVDTDAIFSRNPKRRLQETASRLKRKGLVRYVSENGRTFLRLTPKGKLIADRVANNNYLIKKPLKWDKRWRIIVFDIPESKRHLRNKVRRLLEGLGFHRLQDSVWIYPYSCEDVITILKSDLRIGKDLIYIVADAIEYDKPLLLHFKLK